MNTRRLLPAVLLAAIITTGCVGHASEAQQALRQGRYAEARSQYEDMVARDPGRVDALVGLGISHYKLNEFDDAETALTQALAREPRSATARLYLGLAALQRGDDGRVEEHLGPVMATADPRVGTHIDRTLRTLRGSEPVSSEMRAYMAASVEDEASLARELADTRRALRDSEFRRLTDDRVIYRVPRNCRCS